MDNSMSYEYLIRRIYQVGRYGVRAADADIYREFLSNYHLYKMQDDSDKKRTDDLQYRYQVSLNRIWNYIQEAIVDGNRKHANKLTENEKLTIQNLIYSPKAIDKDYLEMVISTVEKIYVDHKIFPG